MKAMRLIVLDTNALIQSLPTRSQYHRIWTEFLAGKYRLCVSNEILTEYEEILTVHTSPAIAHNVFEARALHQGRAPRRGR
jgi:predicted nucleic acid-binding protein